MQSKWRWIFKNLVCGLFRKLKILIPAYRFFERLISIRRTHAGAVFSFDGLPLPPPYLMTLVGGVADYRSYQKIGSRCFSALSGCLARNNVDTATFGSVLEFGCGSGRVLRHWVKATHTRIYGCDYNGELVEWCSKNLPFAKYEKNSARPPLPYPEAAFDFVYAISVFTHLAEDQQIAWIEELARITRPSGHILITVLGKEAASSLSAKDREQFDSGQLVVRFSEASGLNLCGAYHPREYITRFLPFSMEIIDYAPAREIADFGQDMYLLKKKAHM